MIFDLQQFLVAFGKCFVVFVCNAKSCLIVIDFVSSSLFPSRHCFWKDCHDQTYFIGDTKKTLLKNCFLSCYSRCFRGNNNDESRQPYTVIPAFAVILPYLEEC